MVVDTLAHFYFAAQSVGGVVFYGSCRTSGWVLTYYTALLCSSLYYLIACTVYHEGIALPAQ